MNDDPLNDTLFGLTAVTGTIAAILLVGLVVVGGYQLGWWLEEDAVNRSAEISDQSVNRESALREEALDQHDTVLDLRATLSTATDDQKPALEARIAAAIDRFCDSYGQIDNVDVPDSTHQFANEECA